MRLSLLFRNNNNVLKNNFSFRIEYTLNTIGDLEEMYILSLPHKGNKRELINFF